MPRLSYTPELIAFLQRHWNKDITGVKLAEDLGVSYEALKAAVSRLRKVGYGFESNAAPVGHVVTRRRKDYGTTTRIKTEDGWQYVSLTGVKRNRRKVTEQPKPKQMPRPRANRPKAKEPFYTDRNPVKMKIRSDAEKIAEGWRYVQVDHKTRVLRAPEKLTA